MLPPLIVMSVMTVLGWMMLTSNLRRRHSSPSGKHAPRYPGLPIRLPPLFLPMVVGATLFTAAGWIMYLTGLTGSGGRTGSGAWQNVALLLIGTGGIISLFIMAVTRFPVISRFVPVISRFMAYMETLSCPDSGHPDSGHPDFSDVMSEPEIPVGQVPRRGEHLDGECPANHVQSWLGRGGRLFITSERLVFVASPLSKSRGARDWQLEFRNIIKADVAPRGHRLEDGSLRSRLRIINSSGSVEYFVVWRPKKLAELVNTHIQS